VRVGPAVFGVLSILFFYLILVEIGISKKVGLYTVFLLSVSPWQIQYSRTGFELTLMTMFLFSGLWLLIRGIKFKNYVFLAISGWLLSLSLYTYNTAFLLVPILVCVTLYFLKSTLKQGLFLFILGLLFCFPILVNIFWGNASERFGLLSIFNHKDVTAQVDVYRNADNNSFLSKIFYNKLTVSSKRILFNFSNSLGSNFLFNEGDITFRHSLHQAGNLFWFELPLIVLGLVFIVRKKQVSLGNKWLLSLLLISPIPACITIDGYNHASRLFLLVYPLSALAAIGFVNLSKNIKFLVVVAFLFEFCFFQYYYWTFYKNDSWRWWHTGYKEAMLYVADHKNEYDKVYIDNTYEPALIRYLFWNKIDPKLVTGLDDRGNFCLDKVCFVNFGNNFKIENIDTKTLYLLSQERNVGGDWDLEVNTPDKVKVLKAVRNFNGDPIFYLIESDLN